MSTATESVEAEADQVGQLFDLVTYVVATTLLFVAASAVLAVAVGSRVAPGVKYGLFVFGWLAFGYATYLLFPTQAWEDDDDGRDPFGVPPNGETGFQSLVQDLPPARFRRIQPNHRLPTGIRLFLASLLMLGTSIVLEQAFGIGP
ncbi:DUF7555 family protein [Halobacterium zhouii]|uniref:DUF7555 family protein n=1 Tax=Halobacterium zhouii TaxID=2902624 RepID=UPI001E29F4AA|nr:hypothetical protein [Halobacterium zhouii]